MTALSSDRLTIVTSEGSPVSVPVAQGTIIYAGSIVCADVDGNAIPGALGTFNVIAGIAQHRADNRGKAAGSERVTVTRRHGALLANSASSPVTAAHRFRVCYVEDDQTVRASGEGGYPVAGIVLEVTSAGVLVSVADDLALGNVGYWDDVPPNYASAGSGTAELTVKAFRNTGAEYQFFRHDQIDSYHLRYQMPHRWVVGSMIRPHMHFIPTANGSGTVVISGRYAWTQIGSGQALPSLAGWTSFRVTRAITPADLDQEIVLGIGQLTPPAWAKRSAHFHILWQRPGGAGGDVGDTYETGDADGLGAANLALVSFDCHALLDASGSVDEFGD